MEQIISKNKISDNFELECVSVRLKQEVPILFDYPLNSPNDIYFNIGKYLAEFDREVVCVLNFATDMHPINFSIVSIGCLAEAVCHPREIFKAAILSNAAHMAIIHNHPSGNCNPSKCDIAITDRMIKACDIMGIDLVDHIIVTKNTFFSFREKDMFKKENVKFAEDIKNINFSRGGR